MVVVLSFMSRYMLTMVLASLIHEPFMIGFWHIFPSIFTSLILVSAPNFSASSLFVIVLLDVYGFPRIYMFWNYLMNGIYPPVDKLLPHSLQPLMNQLPLTRFPASLTPILRQNINVWWAVCFILRSPLDQI